MEVTPAMCGNSTACPSCNESASIPSLSQLKRNAGETTSMDSVADQVTRLINDRSPPFDGGCQMCSQNPASELLPTRVVFLEQRILTGSEVAVSEKGVTIGYAPTDEAWHTVFIPCLFCEPCAESFRKEWRKSWINATVSKVMRMIWIVPMANVAIVLIATIPFVGWTVGAFIIYAIYRYLTRKRADAFLASHIRGLGLAAKLLDEDEYFLQHEPFRPIA